MEFDVTIGTVIWFTRFKGYGFIRPDGGGPDVFVHMSAVESAGLEQLYQGQRVNYVVISARGKNTADRLSVALQPPTFIGGNL